MEAIYQQLIAATTATPPDLDVARARARTAGMLDFLGAGPPVAVRREIVLESDHARIPLRLYSGEGVPRGLILYLHGGGWVLNGLDEIEALARQLAISTGCAVLACGYRRAPEHPFPAAAQDSLAALRHAFQLAGRLGIAPGRIAVAGDSAGANLAAHAALDLARSEDLKPAAQLLFYPVCDLPRDSGSYLQFAQGHPLSRAEMEWFFDLYAPQPAQRRQVSLLQRPDLAASVPTLLVTAGLDLLRDEGIDYGAALARAGVPLTHRHFPAVTHGFVRLFNHSAQARLALRAADAFLQGQFDPA